MPAGDAKVRAVCKNRSINLNVINGKGDGTYDFGAVTPIVADEPMTNKMFDKWVVQSGNPKIDDISAPDTTLEMPNEDVVVEATYKNKMFDLIVRNGQGSGTFASDAITLIEADASNDGKVFDRWEIISGNPKIDDTLLILTDLTMPAEDVIVEAKFKKPEKFDLNVRNGEGDGKYEAGTNVEIVADKPKPNEEFEKWAIRSGDPDIEDIEMESTTLNMPAEDVTVRAVYKGKDFPLIVDNGEGGGDYPSQEEVSVTADSCPKDQEFEKWLITNGGPVIFGDINSPSTTIIMPDRSTRIRAVCRDLPAVYQLAVGNGDGDGEYSSGTIVTITADSCPNGQEFDKWDVVAGESDIEDINSPTTTLTMPNSSVQVVARCKNVVAQFQLTVINGDGDGSFLPDAIAPINADDRSAINEEFLRWEVISGGAPIDDSNSARTTVTMPAEDVTIRAIYANPLFALVVDDGDGDGEYSTGTIVTITADSCPNGQEFDKWEILAGEPDIEDINSPTTTLTMPSSSAQVVARCQDIPRFQLTVINGDGDGSFLPDAIARINADDPSAVNEEFLRWEVISGGAPIDDPNSARTTVTMPAEDVIVEAIYGNPCGITNKEREERILTILRGVSGNEPFTNSLSAQSQAASWLIGRDEFFVCPGVRDKKLIQRYILAVFYFSTEGGNWSECFANDDTCGTSTNDFEDQVAYLSPENECDWAGSSCDIDLCITRIIFEENINLRGTLPFEFGDLEGLEVLSLETQQIGGTIPSTLSKPPLRIIDFDFNRLIGTIPESLYTITTLEQLDLNNNLLTGSISNNIGNLSALFFLQLHFNQFTGSYPTSLVQSPLIIAEFQNNNFEGNMPLCIGAAGQTVTAVSIDCPNNNDPCGPDCGCECF